MRLSKCLKKHTCRKAGKQIKYISTNRIAALNIEKSFLIFRWKYCIFVTNSNQNLCHPDNGVKL